MMERYSKIGSTIINLIKIHTYYKSRQLVSWKISFCWFTWAKNSGFYLPKRFFIDVFEFDFPVHVDLIKVKACAVYTSHLNTNTIFLVRRGTARVCLTMTATIPTACVGEVRRAI